MKRERLDWLAASLLYRKRFVWFVGRRCRGMSIRDVAMEVHLDCLMVKGLERQDMAEQLKKGHTYRIVVSDLERNQVRRSYCQM